MQDFNCPLDSAAILFADMDQFSAGDGKQWFGNWKRAFDNGLKSGANIDDNALVPQAKADLEKKKYAVIEAQNDLNFAKKIYDSKRENAANQDDPGEEGAKGALRFRRQQHERFSLYIK